MFLSVGNEGGSLAKGDGRKSESRRAVRYWAVRHRAVRYRAVRRGESEGRGISLVCDRR